jgi:HEAT repeat protein
MARTRIAIPLVDMARSLTAAVLLSILAAHSFAAEAGKDPVRLAANLASPEVTVRREAAYQLEKLGPAAKPALGSLIIALEDRDRQVWSNALSAIAAIGPDAKDAIPILMRDLDSRTARGQRYPERDQGFFRSAYALSRIGPPAIPILVDALRGDDTMLRAGAAKALGGMGSIAKEAIPALAENLGHQDKTLREEIISAFGEIGSDAEDLLIEALGWKEPLQRQSAAFALSAMGRSAPKAAPALFARLEVEDDAGTRAAILLALPRTNPDGARFVPHLIAGLRDEHEPIRQAAINGLLTVLPARKQIVESLSQLLADKDPVVSERAAYVLGRLGEAATPAVPAIIATIRKQQQPSQTFVDALIQIGEPAVPAIIAGCEKIDPATITSTFWAVDAIRSMGGIAVRPVGQKLSDPQPSVRLVAIRTAGELGPEAESLIPALTDRLDDPEVRLRANALVALFKIGASLTHLTPRLEAAFKDSSPMIRAAAIEAAIALGDEGRPFHARIVASLKDPDPEVRQAALRVLDGRFKDAVPGLISMLDDKAQRSAAVAALGQIGSPAQPSVARLSDLFSNSSKDEKVGILATLGRIGPAAVDSRSVLEKARTDSDPGIRAAAMTATAAIEPDSGNRIDALRKGLGDPDLAVRRSSAEAVARLGDRGLDAAPQVIGLLSKESDREFALEAVRQLPLRDPALLLPLLSSGDREIKLVACERIGRMGKNGSAAAEALRTASRDADEEVARGARRALRAIGAR